MGATFPVFFALNVGVPLPLLWTLSFLPMFHHYSIPSLIAKSEAS